MSTFKKAFLGVFLALLFILVITTLLLKYNEDFGCFFLKEDTTYTDQFAEKGFRALKVGMGTQEVQKVLGLPFREVHYQVKGETRSAWVYSMQNPTGVVHNFRKRVVEFDEKGHVSRKETGLYVD
jgi:outer membrane protein assembly factor BamE (lipoprotein component of BamABCDE complex)